MKPEYLDFELEIGLGQGREYPVAVLRSPGGEARAVMRFPFDTLQLENRLKDLQIALLRSGGARRVALNREQREVQEFGQALFDALVAGDVRSLYDVSHTKAGSKGLRIKLRIADPGLAALPWEFLYDPRRSDFVCLSSVTPLVRYLELPQPPQPLAVDPPLRVLGMIASPSNLSNLDVERERERIERALAELRQKGLVELKWVSGPTWRDLQRALRRGPWHVFHFVGHGAFDAGADEGLVMVCDDAGQARPLRATELGRFLANHRSLRLAVLNACEGARGGERDIFSSTASLLVRAGLPAVLAMQYEITDRAAIELSRAFYEAIADGLPVDAAVAEARIAVSVAVTNTVEWGTPVLYMRAPDGVIFDVGEAAAHPTLPGGAVQPAIPAPPKPAGPRLLAVPGGPSIELVLVPAGEFLMGSDPTRDRQAYDDEKKQHSLFVDAFAIGKHPVTVAQFAAFVNATGFKTTAETEGKGRAFTGSQWEWVSGADWRHPRGPKSDVSAKADHPVTQVSWHDALAFCDWVGARLPSEAEWEKAARGADGRLYPWGDPAPDKARCNFNMNIGDTTPVGQYPDGASPYGVLDMSGNVWEWTRSLWGKDGSKPSYGYPYRVDDGRELLTAPDDVLRVVRGGSFFDGARFVRCAVRVRGRGWNGNYGFRVVVSPGL